MGLDQFVYKVGKLSAEEQELVRTIKNAEELQKKIPEFTYSLEPWKEVKEELHDIEDFILHETISVELYDKAKIAAALEVSEEDIEDMYLGIVSREYDVLVVFVNGEGHRLKVLREEKAKYKSLKEVPALLYKTEQIAYWRKDSYVDGYLCEWYLEETGRKVTNCGYHKISSEALEGALAISENGGLTSDYEIGPDEILAYCIWY